MAKQRLLYLLFLLAALALALGYESRLTFVLLIAATALPLISFLLFVCTRLLIKVETAPKSMFVHKLQEFSVCVKVRNRFILPVSPLRLTGNFHDSDGRVTGERQLIVSVMPFSTAEFLFTGNILYRGEYSLGLEAVDIYDLLRLFRFRIRLTPDCTAVVAPRQFSIEDDNVLSGDDFDSNRTTPSFMENTAFAAVRKYTEGDSLRHVHWKLSAKQDELVVKQMEQNLGSNTIIIADTTGIFEEDEDNMRTVDAVIESALAFTRKIIADGRCAVNLFRDASGEAEVIAAETRGDYERLFLSFSTLPISEVGTGAAVLAAEQKKVFDNAETLFIIAPALTADELHSIMSCGGEAMKSIRIYLTGEKADDELMAAAAARSNITVFGIDPEDIGLSLRNSMK